MNERPTLHVIAGPNGAGKSTMSQDYLPTVGNPPFLNADVIAERLSPGNPDAVLLEAGRQLLAEVDRHVEERRSFCLETTLSGKAYHRLLRRVRAEGYRVVMKFVWIDSAELSLKRVAQRVTQGGHDVPEDAVRRRHPATLKNFRNLYLPLLHEWQFFDNSYGMMELIAEGLSDVHNERRFQELFK